MCCSLLFMEVISSWFFLRNHLSYSTYMCLITSFASATMFFVGLANSRKVGFLYFLCLIIVTMLSYGFTCSLLQNYEIGDGKLFVFSPFR